MSQKQQHTVALVGLGTIGLSFAALHLQFTDASVRLYDVRADLQKHVAQLLPVYLRARGAVSEKLSVENLISSGRLTLCPSLEDACKGATIVQEQGPENLPFKKQTWAVAAKHAPTDAHLWSSTSGILASQQGEDLAPEDRARLLIVHPFNPPHLTPLIEIVPSQYTNPERTEFAKQYIDDLKAGYNPVIIKKEILGFVGNRLAFALFREACHLVASDVVTVEDLDTIITTSHGPRWAVAGPFKLWNLGGGAGGLGAFMHNLGGTAEAIWQDLGQISLKDTYEHAVVPLANGSTDGTRGESGDDWLRKVVQQTTDAYNLPSSQDFLQRDVDLGRVMQAKSK